MVLQRIIKLFWTKANVQKLLKNRKDLQNHAFSKCHSLSRIGINFPFIYIYISTHNIDCYYFIQNTGLKKIDKLVSQPFKCTPRSYWIRRGRIVFASKIIQFSTLLIACDPVSSKFYKLQKPLIALVMKGINQECMKCNKFSLSLYM